MTIFWKDINLILYPDPELTRLPPVIIPQCQWKLFERSCEKVWAKQVILPWLQQIQGIVILCTKRDNSKLVASFTKFTNLAELNCKFWGIHG